MDYEQLITDRYSVRKFSDRKVESEKLDQILRAGQVAPTACNNQPQRVLVIEGEEMLAKLRKCTMSHFQCTLALLICYDKTACWVREYDGKNSGDIDATIVTTQMMLMAHSLGIGTTFVMHYIPEAVREEFALPESYESTAILVMGYPADDAKPSPRHTERKDRSETVFTRFE